MREAAFFYVILAVFGVLLIPSSLKASAERHLRMGDVMAADRLGSIEADKAKAGDHPFFYGKSQGEGLDPAVTKMLQTPGKKFVIHAGTDPLVRSADRIRDASLKTIGGQGTRSVTVTQKTRDELVRCEEPGDDAPHQCKAHIEVEVREELGDPIAGSWEVNGPSGYGMLHGLLMWDRVQDKHHVAHIQGDSLLLRSLIAGHIKVPVERIVSAGTQNMGEWQKVGHKEYVFGSYLLSYSHRPLVKVAYSTWHSECDNLEARADEGVCTYASQECLQGPETRIFDTVKVYHPCWEERFTYNCDHSAGDGCGPLRAKGCVQTKSDCKKWIGKICVAYTQTYQCKGDTKNFTRIQGGDTPFCLDGACRDQLYENNDEMMSSISQLALLKEMQNAFNLTVFKGNSHQCSKDFLNFKDCCGSGKGWGISFGLAGCKEEEKALQLRRTKGLCHLVGTYCSKWDPVFKKKCIQKRTSYCCFGSKLLKAFQVQGRDQIGKRWGTPKEPDCNGFSVDELQRIDFSKIDLREAFEDLMQNFEPAKVQDVNEQIQDRLEMMQEDIREQNPLEPGTSPQQRKSA